MIECLNETRAGSKCQINYYWRANDGLVSRARNELSRIFLKKNFDYLMWIDDDIIWNTKYKILDLLVRRNKDIICGVYPVRDGSCQPAIRTKEIQKLIDTGKYKSQKITVPKNKVFEIEYGSTGFMMIKRKVVEEVYKKHPYPYQPIFPKGEYLSEDWAFCHRAKDMGYKIWADSTFELGHIGTTIFTLRKNNCK